MEYLTSLSLAEIIQRIIIMEFWIALIAFFVFMLVLTLREYDDKFHYPKEWKKKDEEWNLPKCK